MKQQSIDNRKIPLFISLVLILILIAVSIWLWPKNPKPPASNISNFEDCAGAGYPVAESNLPKCRTPDGKVFTQNIGNELEKKELIRVNNPRPNAVVTSPLTITGEARGNWYFEAAFPIKLVDEKGEELGRTVAAAQGDWTTVDFVPFTAELTFTAPAPGKGTLILEKDNPSGLPQNADELRIPVSYEAIKTRSIELFYYNTQKDSNQSCSPDAVLPVTRGIPVTQTPIQDAVRILLKGELTSEEKTGGFTTEFPLSGFELKGANLKDGVLTLEFSDPQGKTTGGSCRVRLLWAQIEKTAQQFPQVREVRFIPESLFQP